jgi:hypothetical protein
LRFAAKQTNASSEIEASPIVNLSRWWRQDGFTVVSEDKLICKFTGSQIKLRFWKWRSAVLRAGLRQRGRSCFATFAARLKPCPDTCLTQGCFSLRYKLFMAAEPNPRHPALRRVSLFFCRAEAARNGNPQGLPRVGSAQRRSGRSINGKKTEIGEDSLDRHGLRDRFPGSFDSPLVPIPLRKLRVRVPRAHSR